MKQHMKVIVSGEGTLHTNQISRTSHYYRHPGTAMCAAGPLIMLRIPNLFITDRKEQKYVMKKVKRRIFHDLNYSYCNSLWLLNGGGLSHLIVPQKNII